MHTGDEYLQALPSLFAVQLSSGYGKIGGESQWWDYKKRKLVRVVTRRPEMAKRTDRSAKRFPKEKLLDTVGWRVATWYLHEVQVDL